MDISTHALREEGDKLRNKLRIKHCKISTHALREEGDLPASLILRRNAYFYPRPPRGGRLGYDGRIGLYVDISTHALREEGDIKANTDEIKAEQFLPTPSARRATNATAFAAKLKKISTHALREEGDVPLQCGRGRGRAISTHALREEGDVERQQRPQRQFDFYPRPPRGGRRSARRKVR